MTQLHKLPETVRDDNFYAAYDPSSGQIAILMGAAGYRQETFKLQILSPKDLLSRNGYPPSQTPEGAVQNVLCWDSWEIHRFKTLTDLAKFIVGKTREK